MKQKRIRFEGEQQKLFIRYAIRFTKCSSLKEFNKYFSNTPYSTLKKYAHSNYLLPISVFQKICSLCSMNPNSLNVEYLESNWGAIKGGKKGIFTMREKYKSKLKEWCSKGGINSGITNIKVIKYPKLNDGFAEFIGAYLGDGTLTKYFIRISGDYRYDLPYFNYLSKLIFKLFEVCPKISKDSRKGINTAYLTLASKKACSFLNEKYGIKYGDKIKNKTMIPQRILSKRHLALSCLRGLVDTDGSVSRRGRGGSQFCVQFSNYNKELLKQVNYIGKKYNIFTYLTGHETGTNKWANVIKYFRMVGSSNLRHIVRFYERFNNKAIYQKEVCLYYKKPLYRNLQLPFKMGLSSNG